MISPRANLDVMIVVGDDQREIFKDACRPAIGIYYGESIRNAAAPTAPTDDWYLLDQRRRLEDGQDRFYPCHPALGSASHRGTDATELRYHRGQGFGRASNSKVTPIRSFTGGT